MTSAVLPAFGRWAAAYEQHAAVQREAASWLAEWLPAEIRSPVLELGAGTGFFTRHLAERARELVASDIAPGMVGAGKLRSPGAEWIVADAAKPPGGRAYGLIASCSLVQWIPDPAAAFRAWHHVAAPGAHLLSGWFIRGTLDGFFAGCPEAAPFTWRTAGEWIDLLGQAGWNVRRQGTKTIVRRHADAAGMLREMHNAGAVVPHRVGPGRLRRALREYDRAHRGQDGVRSTFEFLRVEAVRS